MHFILRAATLAAALAFASQPVVAEPVTLEQAIRRASEAAPMLLAGDAAVAAARAGARQADIRPSPSLSVEGENLIGTGPFGVLAESEISVTYSQPYERGGKREARVGFAEADIGVAQAGTRVARLELAAAVQRAYIDVQIAEANVRISRDRLSTETEMQTEAVRRVRAYRDPLFVETRAEARVAQARLGLDEALARQASARTLLASYWGGQGDVIEVSEGLILSVGILEVADPSEIAAADLALRDAEIARARAAVVVEQSLGVQDYTLSGGARYLRGPDDVALLAGVTIPLGGNARNQGNVERAQAQRQQLEWAAEADRLERLRTLASLRADADAARGRAEAIMAQVYPRATETLAQVREGYNRGGFTFRDVQDAADAILEVQDQWLEAIIRHRDAQTEIDRLTGRFDAAAPMETNL